MMMRRKFFFWLVLVFLISLSTSTGARERPKPDWKSLGEGAALALKTNKKSLIFVYTDWCSWCKRMDAQVYTDPSVIKYVNETFVPIRVNAESNSKHRLKANEITEAQFAKAYGVRGFPTTLFTMPNGQMITAVPGFIGPEKFLQILKYIGGEHYLKMKFEEYVKKGGK